jgi:lipoprotein-anchoring transpeptidase ErfK/SrfK
MSNHRREVRPRYGRIAALVTSVTVTVVAGLAGLGILAPSTVHADLARPAAFSAGAGAASSPPTVSASGGASSTSGYSGPADGDQSDLATTPSSGATSSPQDAQHSSVASTTVDSAAVPVDSGSGRRIVFSQSLQRVWLVDGDDSAERTYLVSGSVTDNLQPGTYSVYSKSRWAVGVDDSGVMQYFVRFTQGPTGAAIGFHTIPTSHGTPLQTKAELGTPQSHGCIRQDTPDAIALWTFAPVGTKVVVVA